jgi:hypothetical protein
VYEKRVLRKIFRPKRDAVAGGWRRLHNEELHKLYSLPYVIRDDQVGELGGSCSIHGEMRNAFKMLFGKPEGLKPLGIPRHRWEDNIGMDLGEI